MKKLSVIFAVIVALFTFSGTNRNQLTEDEAIKVITSHPLFQVYEEYLQQKHNAIKVYKVSAELFGHGYDPFGDYYILTFQNTLDESSRETEADLLVVKVNIFSRSAILLSVIYKGDYYAVESSVIFKDTY